MGIHEVSGEHIIGTCDGCLKTKDIRRKPESDRWKWENMVEIKGTPWEPVPGHPDRELKSRVFIREAPILPPPAAAEEPEILKRVYIRKSDVMKYGATPGCDGCRAAIRGG